MFGIKADYRDSISRPTTLFLCSSLFLLLFLPFLSPSLHLIFPFFNVFLLFSVRREIAAKRMRDASMFAVNDSASSACEMTVCLARANEERFPYRSIRHMDVNVTLRTAFAVRVSHNYVNAPASTYVKCIL